MRKTYSKPIVKSVKIDNQIYMVIMLPPTDPGETSLGSQSTNINPFKID
jgi:hypothetical protein